MRTQAVCAVSNCLISLTLFDLKRHHFCSACCSWTSGTDELFLEQNVAATICLCLWAVCNVTALIAFHYIYIYR